MRKGKFHADVLAMFSLLGGVLLKEYLAAAVIVLMMWYSVDNFVVSTKSLF